MNAPEWFQDPRIKNISPDKLAFLLKLAEQIEGKNQKQAMPILIGAVSSASRQNPFLISLKSGDDGLHLLPLLFHICHQPKLGAGPVQVMLRITGFKVDVIL